MFQTWILSGTVIVAVMLGVAESTLGQECPVLAGESQPPGSSLLDYFGYSVSLSDHRLIVGANWEDLGGAPLQTDAGAAYIYKMDRNTKSWVKEQRLIADGHTTGDEFGSAVSISGNLALVGAQYSDVFQDGTVMDAGSAFVFHKNPRSGSWYQDAQLSAVIAGGDAKVGARFGHACAISDGRIIVGARSYDDGTQVNVGRAYVFRHDGAIWIPDQTYYSNSGILPNPNPPPENPADDIFGYSVALRGDWAAVGAYGASKVYIYYRDPILNQWLLHETLVGGNLGDGFGSSVSLNDSRLAVGAYTADLTDPFVENAGKAYVYSRDATNVWGPTPEATLQATDGQAADYFGVSLALNALGDTLIVGAFGDDDKSVPPESGLDAGAAYKFVRQGVSWLLFEKLYPEEEGNCQTFGWTVAISGSNVVIGAPYNLTYVPSCEFHPEEEGKAVQFPNACP